MSTHELSRIRDEIASVEGSGTELVTLTVPPDDSVRDAAQRIAQEHAEASNIKSKQTRENVERALDRLRRELASYDGTPEMGVVAYVGVVDDDLVVRVLDDELPEPVDESTYHCDKRFDTDVLDRVLEPDTVIGLIVLERGRAALGRLLGDRIVPVDEIESHVMGKTRAGGQSAQRFARERQRQLHEFFQNVAERARMAFVGEVDVCLVGGTLTTAQEFVDGEYLDYRLQEMCVGPYSVEYATERGLEQLVESADDAVLDAENREVREAIESFRAGLGRGDDKNVTYGISEVRQATEYGAVDTLLCDPDRADAEQLASDVRDNGGTVVWVRGDTDAGERFLSNFGGVGALCRFPVA